MRFRILIAPAFLLGCATIPTGLQGHWTGTITPLAGNCDPSTPALLIIYPGDKPPYAASFSPSQGVLTLRGTSDGIVEVATSLQVTGVDHKPYAMAFNGISKQNSIIGTFVTPRCLSSVALHRD